MNVTGVQDLFQVLGSHGNNPYSYAQSSDGASGSGLRDCYISSGDDQDPYGIYSKTAVMSNGYLSEEFIYCLNDFQDFITGRGGIYEYHGIKFTTSQIPPVNKAALEEVKADGNVIDFGRRRYFKYVSPDGEEHYLYTRQKRIGDIESERLRGAPRDPVLEQYSGFWCYLMSPDPVYIGLSYTSAQIREYLDEAGMKVGFFTIKMGDEEVTHYYSASKTTGPIQSKDRYDWHYQCLTQEGGILHDYEPGSIFTVGGKKYVLSESHTLDIPYGADIYDMKYPKIYSRVK